MPAVTLCRHGFPIGECLQQLSSGCADCDRAAVIARDQAAARRRAADKARRDELAPVSFPAFGEP